MIKYVRAIICQKQILYTKPLSEDNITYLDYEHFKFFDNSDQEHIITICLLQKSNKDYYAALSYLNPGDQFVKYEGRSVAWNKLIASRHYYRIYIKEDEYASHKFNTMKEIVEGILTLQYYFKNNNFTDMPNVNLALESCVAYPLKSRKKDRDNGSN